MLPFFTMLLIGFVLIVMGLVYTFDYTRYLYIFPEVYGGKFIVIPGGAMTLFFTPFTLIDINMIPASAAVVISISFVCCLFWFHFAPPRFLHPGWYKWIIDHHWEIWPLLREEASKDYGQWYAETKTIKELEVWVKSVREKYGLG